MIDPRLVTRTVRHSSTTTYLGESRYQCVYCWVDGNLESLSGQFEFVGLNGFRKIWSVECAEYSLFAKEVLKLQTLVIEFNELVRNIERYQSKVSLVLGDSAIIQPSNELEEFMHGTD